MKKQLSTFLSCAVLTACAVDGRDNAGRYADVTVTDVRMSRLDECEAQLQQLANRLAVKASSLAGKEIRPVIAIREVETGILATAEVKENVITVNPVLCKTNITPRVRYIIAHELGHYVAEKLNLSRAGAYSVVGNHRISEQAERDADSFAIRILGGSGVPAFEYLHHH